jgi:hypothetical protein
MACARDKRGWWSAMRSTCHSSVRKTCSASAGLRRHGAGRPSSATAMRKGVVAAASPKWASAGGSSPRPSACSQTATSASRCPHSPLLLTRPGSHNARGNACKRS